MVLSDYFFILLNTHGDVDHISGTDSYNRLRVLWEMKAVHGLCMVLSQMIQSVYTQ